MNMEKQYIIFLRKIKKVYNNKNKEIIKDYSDSEINLEIKYLKNYYNSSKTNEELKINKSLFSYSYEDKKLIKYNILLIDNISQLLELNMLNDNVKVLNISNSKFQPSYNRYLHFLRIQKVIALLYQYNKDPNQFSHEDLEEYIKINNIRYPIKALCRKLIPLNKFFDTSSEYHIHSNIIKLFKNLIFCKIDVLHYIKYIFDNNIEITYYNNIKDNNLFEGTKKQISITTYDRNKEARKKCLEHYGYNCQICTFNFEKVYGKIGKDFIHVHHIVNISTIGKTKVNPIKDLIPVCPNCHAMLHVKMPAYSIKEIKNLLTSKN